MSSVKNDTKETGSQVHLAATLVEHFDKIGKKMTLPRALSLLKKIDKTGDPNFTVSLGN